MTTRLGRTVLTLTFVCTGCGTIATRTSWRNELSDDFPPVYAATYVDGGLITAPCRSAFEGSAGKKAGVCVVGVIDLPLSLAIDTLLLPYDAISSAAKSDEVAQPDGPANRSLPFIH
jgi:uncharacterized protein YceK